MVYLSLHVLTSCSFISYNGVVNKTEFLQIRVTSAEKKEIQTQAKKLGMDMSVWVKSRLFSEQNQNYRELIDSLLDQNSSKEALASLNDFLHALSAKDFHEVVTAIPEDFFNSFTGNYIAAMVEMAAHQKNITSPSWTKKYMGISEPYFSSAFEKLRLHLLVSSPIPFRRRNIFIDSTVGDRV